MNRIKFISLGIIWMCLLGWDTQAQDWRKIIPLVSSCDDVKREFAIEKCELPYVRKEFPQYRITVIFARQSNEWKAPEGTVVGLLISYTEWPSVWKFGCELNAYEVLVEPDSPSVRIFRNKEKGIDLTVHNIAGGGDHVSNVYVYPSQPRVKR